MILINKKVKKPYISIITVCKNSSKTLERCIKSVINQNYKNYEHIIIDGGSTDQTLKIILKNKKHLRYALSEKDKNLWHAINKGIKIAKGEVIGITQATLDPKVAIGTFGTLPQNVNYAIKSSYILALLPMLPESFIASRGIAVVPSELENTLANFIKKAKNNIVLIEATQ